MSSSKWPPRRSYTLPSLTFSTHCCRRSNGLANALRPLGAYSVHVADSHQLHHEPQKYRGSSESESLMISTLGSQEGAFENDRMSFTGDQGQTIGQLLSAHVLRRVRSMPINRFNRLLLLLFFSSSNELHSIYRSRCAACLPSPHGRRQHLAMSG